MSRKGNWHYNKSGKDKLCSGCKVLILKGWQQRYWNEFTGDRSYYHSFPSCEDAALKLGNAKLQQPTAKA